MTSINRQPAGWLGFLGVKNFGRAPSRTGEILQPVWDLSELYLSAHRTWSFNPLTISALGNLALPAVPTGQIWYVEHASISTETLVAGNELDFRLMMLNNASGSSVIFGGAPNIAPVVGGRAVAVLDNPVILQPGESLGVYVNRFAGANINSFLNFSYTRLDA